MKLYRSKRASLCAIVRYFLLCPLVASNQGSPSIDPAIFRGLKSLTNKDPLQASLLRLIASGIALYCPHTAVDAAHGGLNDWLCDILVNGQSDFKSTVVQPIFRPLPEALKGTGYGRSIQLSTPMTLTALLKNLSSGLDNQRYMSVAMPGILDVSEIQDITKIAVCAGSGADVLKDSDAQLLVTGEMVHHEALRHVGLGHVVVTVFHSNSERQYLTQRLKPMLEKELSKIAGGKEGRVVVSTKDRDPYVTMDISKLA